jgi:hypothetical protein
MKRVLSILVVVYCAFSVIKAQNTSDNTGAMIPPIVIRSENPDVSTYYQLGNRSMDKALFARAKRY